MISAKWCNVTVFFLQVDKTLGRDRAAVGSGVWTVRRKGEGGKQNLGFDHCASQMFPGATNRQLLFVFIGSKLHPNAANKMRIMELTMMEGNSVTFIRFYYPFQKTFVYTVCLHNHLPKITIPLMLHMYFMNFKTCITVCRSKCPAYQWGILSSALVTGCLEKGGDGTLTRSPLVCFSQPFFFFRLISRPTYAFKLSSAQ